MSKNPTDVITSWKRERESAGSEKSKQYPWNSYWGHNTPPTASAQQIACALNEYHLPPSSHTARQRMFVARKVPATTLRMAASLIGEVNSTIEKNISVTKVFHEFVLLNDAPPGTVDISFLFLLFFIDITLQGLGIGSAITYARGILGVEARAGRPIQGCHVEDLFKILQLLKASEEVDHAVDIELPKAWEIVNLLARVSQDVQMLAWLMVVTGGRAKDLQRMNFGQFTFNVVNGCPQMKVHFKYTKGRRSETKQYILPVKLSEEIQIPELVKSAFRVTAKQVYIVRSGADELNAAIAKLGPQYADITSYSFRRLFVHRCIELFKDDEGHIAWAEVMKLTGHVHVETLRTSYARVEDRVL